MSGKAASLALGQLDLKMEQHRRKASKWCVTQHMCRSTCRFCSYIIGTPDAAGSQDVVEAAAKGPLLLHLHGIAPADGDQAVCCQKRRPHLVQLPAEAACYSSCNCRLSRCCP